MSTAPRAGDLVTFLRVDEARDPWEVVECVGLLLGRHETPTFRLATVLLGGSLVEVLDYDNIEVLR